jgi:hypothetical protein
MYITINGLLKHAKAITRFNTVSKGDLTEDLQKLKKDIFRS